MGKPLFNQWARWAGITAARPARTGSRGGAGAGGGLDLPGFGNLADRVSSKPSLSVRLLLSSVLCLGGVLVSPWAYAENILIQDDFNDALIDTSHWITGGFHTTEHDGFLDIKQNVTDKGGWAKTIEFNPINNLRLEVEHTMHAGGNYFFPGFSFDATQSIGSFSVQWQRSNYSRDYCYDNKFYNKISIQGFGGQWGTHCYAASNLTSSDYYDKKIKSVITYDSVSGDIKLDIGGDGSIDFYAIAPVDKRFPIKQIHIGGYGWWTGHYHQIDSFKLVSLDSPSKSAITDVSPKTTVIGSPTVFTVTGTNLMEGMGFTVGDCAFSNHELAGGTSKRRRFVCTQYGKAETKTGLVKTAPGGTTLFDFTVQAKPDSVPEIYAATDKKILRTSSDVLSVLLSTTVQNRLNTQAAYDVYVKFTLPDGSVFYDDGTQLVIEKKPFLSNFTVSQASDWSDLLRYSLPDGSLAGSYHIGVELWKPQAKAALSKSSTLFAYEPAAALANVDAPNSPAIKYPAKLSVLSSPLSLSSDSSEFNPNDWLKKYQNYCKKNPDGFECKQATRTLLALQLGTKYFEKLGGVDGVVGAYGIFKKGEKLAGHLAEVESLLDSYWAYQNNPALTNDQRILLTAMKVADAALSDYMTSFVSLGDVADSLELVLEKLNEQKTFLANLDATAYDVYFNVNDDCYLWGCDMKGFEITPIFTLSLPPGSTGFEGIPLNQYTRNYTNETNVGALTKIKTAVEPSPGFHDYYFQSLPMGLYMVTVRYANGEVYRQPLFVEKTNETYTVTTAHD